VYAAQNRPVDEVRAEMRKAPTFATRYEGLALGYALGVSGHTDEVVHEVLALTLATRAFLALIALAVGMGALLFVPAGTVDYWHAWVYLAVFVGASAFTTVDVAKRDPALLERRMRGGPTAEKDATQRVIMVLASLGFIALLVVPAFDHRFHWSVVPLPGVLVGDLLVVIGFYFIVLVYRENTFTAATIEVAPGQTVVSTGPYAIGRHPMYASALLYLVGTPLALGSYRGLLAFVGMVLVLIWRLLEEERMLARDLPGYAEYQTRVRYRLVPYVW
jgi:protein-S-isoprenylcysteine O-methyltransferase Ste14